MIIIFIKTIDNMAERKYDYSATDFVIGQNKEGGKSKFTTTLCNAWDKAMEEGVFWYSLYGVERKVLPGKYGITAQLNKKRFSERRKPDAATQVVMPFNQEKFNFNKIKDSEVLFMLNRTDLQEERNDKIIVNVSPIEYGHVLLVPNIDHGLSQILDKHSIEVAVELCLLAKSGFRIGFNSLCALASVNHLHFHAFQYDQQLPIDISKLKLLKKNLFKLDAYMVNGYALQLVDLNIKELASDVVAITNYLCQNNIAHNLAMCRHESVRTQTDDSALVTVFIFPKKPSPECTNDPFNTASLECSGFLPIRDESEYVEMTEDSAIQILNKFTYTNEEFEKLSQNIFGL
ncbi:GDP-D-glucose phosphorylase 1-like isoform X2 [Hydractinia symbiolongicarpus]|uniref:GDP-D-glucose phosphorylase 1-like isoform X2 n=1 Tax=Hydractinia symbiolongicarpus TaxID=13093 RepID=UPI00254D31B4|nr:GDP-D-glucose phosphorylase 1-like isoform X2 [Hydractinia symbiolongicarpus]